MPDHFVHVGVKIVGKLTVFFVKINFALRIGKFFHHPAAFCRFIVGIADIAQGYRLGAVFFSNPVGVRKIHTDRRIRAGVAAQGHYGNYFGGDSLHIFLFVLVHDGGMQLEPVGILADGFGPFGSFHVAERNHRLVASPEAQRIAVGFNKSVNHIDHGIRVLCPRDAVFIVCIQIAGFIKFYEKIQRLFLRFIFSNAVGLFQPVDNLSDSRRIHAIYLPLSFENSAIFFNQL